MKMMRTIFAALMILSLLTGCASDTTVLQAETLPESIPETTVSPETLPETQATEAPVEAAPFVVEIKPVITETQTQVTVTTTDEFLAAIAPNTEIIVDAELIDWSKATGYGKTNGEYYRWDDPYDGPQLVISGVSNLTIRGAGRTTLPMFFLPFPDMPMW